MPFLSNQEGKRVEKNFVYMNFVNELGRSTGRKRVNDELKFDEATGKWEIVRLAPNGNSMIKQYPEEWNAFYDGVSLEEIGTSLDMLFPYDPSRVDMYKRYHIHTIERLANLTESDAVSIGMGGLDDKKKAMKYVERMNAAVTGVQFNAHVQTIEAENAALKAQLADLSEKFARFLESREESEVAPKKSIGKSKKAAQPEVTTGGLNG